MTRWLYLNVVIGTYVALVVTLILALEVLGD